MLPLINLQSQRVLRRRPARLVAAPRRQRRFSLIQTSRSILQTSWNIVRWSKKLAFFLLPPLIYDGIKLVVPRVIQRPVRRQLSEVFTRRLAAISLERKPQKAAALVEVPDEFDQLFDRYREFHRLAETNPALLKAKFEAAAQLYRGQHCDRVRLLRELARLATIRGDDLLSCAYRVRAIRLLGRDSYGDLPDLMRTLEGHGFASEAEALAAMYQDPDQAPGRCQRLLEQALNANRRPPAAIEFERFDDRRHPENPRVAVIVSLYSAADKLPLFLHAFRNQSLLKERQLELILIDSGSPADEHAALTNTVKDLGLPYVYARTSNRETIQTAWNRGIALARAPYLSFLGVDEAVTPEALGLLADALDTDPSIDWVQGDSLLTEVDQNGFFNRDIMLYDRDGYTANHVYLETCYLSWVGAMYRRSIHDRFGYYDGSFRATGDNEFKLRILPFIKTRRIPQLLGLFVNYPEPRATGSPVAELEDIRAWYLHRTLGGVRYALDRRDPCEAEKLLLLSLGYRKSYTNHVSSDIEYAAHVAAHLRERLPASPLVGLIPGIDRLLRAVRAHDHPEPLTPAGLRRTLSEAGAAWAAVGAEHRHTPWLNAIEYNVIRDNRHEQHAFLY